MLAYLHANGARADIGSAELEAGEEALQVTEGVCPPAAAIGLRRDVDPRAGIDSDSGSAGAVVVDVDVPEGQPDSHEPILVC
jgi:hypothetical protein